MSTSPGRYKNLVTSVVTAGVVGFAFVVIRYRKSIFKNIQNIFNQNNPLYNQTRCVVNTRSECESAIEKIYRSCNQYRVVGFDCEWVTVNGSRHPVALLQLSSYNGFCALFRLSKIRYIPSELKKLLEDDTILKVGIVPLNDAKYLFQDYDVNVNGTLDLRFLALSASEEPGGLSSLAQKHLNVELDKNWRIRCSDWEVDCLSEQQLSYAASDAHVAVEIFKIFTDKICKAKYGLIWARKNTENRWKDIEKECQAFVNVGYKQKIHQISKNVYNKNSENVEFKKLLSDQQEQSMNQPNFKQPKRNYQITTRSKPLYQNCYMQKQNGDVLCTCDLKKAKWYVEKNLATVFCEEPFTIRLNFKPAGESVQDVDKYYQIPRENQCVVCGKTHSYIRKNVVPREYRKGFPNVMKSHTSHDVLLLCGVCHQRSNCKDQILRQKLSDMCDAPFDYKKEPKYKINRHYQKVASAAKALLKANHNIPEDRIDELKKIVLNFYEEENITDELLKEACNLNYSSENPAYNSHGTKVVEYFSKIPGGLLQLEEMWRQYFLDSMTPKYMPELWSVSHNKSRLEIRATEGRLQKKDLLLAGLENGAENDKS